MLRIIRVLAGLGIATAVVASAACSKTTDGHETAASPTAVTTTKTTATATRSTSVAPTTGKQLTGPGATLTCGQLKAMSDAQQQQVVNDMARQLDKVLIYSNSNGYKIVVAMCTHDDQLVKDSFGFA